MATCPPLALEATEEELCRLRLCVACYSTATAQKMTDALKGVVHWYECVQSLLRLPCNEQNGGGLAQVVEEELEESVKLLDMCGATRDNLCAMRMCVQDLELAVRRRGRGCASIESKVQAYARLAKKAGKDIKKHHLSGKHESSGGHLALIRMLIEARQITVAVLQSIVSVLSRQMVGLNKPASKWSCVSKAFQKRRVACEDAEADQTLPFASYCSKDLHGEKAVSAQKELRTLGDSIEGLEHGLELLFRHLIQSRVCLLNRYSS